jgi:hypothetical protein
MIRLTLRLALMLVIVTLITLAATHARSVDSSLTTLLTPSLGCSGDDLCFMGIRPGKTTVRDAVTLLRAHPWVADVHTRPPFSQATWTWSGGQPDYIDSTVPGTIMQREYNSVSWIRFRTRYRYGDVWLQLGTPQTGYAWRQPSSLLHGVYYPAYSLLAINYIACPVHLNDFWGMPVIVQFGDAYVVLDSGYPQQSVRFRTC